MVKDKSMLSNESKPNGNTVTLDGTDFRARTDNKEKESQCIWVSSQLKKKDIITVTKYSSNNGTAQTVKGNR